MFYWHPIVLLFLFMIFTLPNLTMFDPSTDNNKSLCLFCVDEKACCRCRHAGSPHYKPPERQNKPDDGASQGQRAIQQPVGGFHSRVTLHLSMLPLPLRLLAQ